MNNVDLNRMNVDLRGKAIFNKNTQTFVPLGNVNELETEAVARLNRELRESEAREAHDQAIRDKCAALKLRDRERNAAKYRERKRLEELGRKSESGIVSRFKAFVRSIV